MLNVGNCYLHTWLNPVVRFGQERPILFLGKSIGRCLGREDAHFPAYTSRVIHHDQRRIFHTIHLWWGLIINILFSPLFLFPVLINIHLRSRKRGWRWWNQNTQELFSLGCLFSPLWIISADRWPVWPSVSLLHMPVVGPLASALELNEGFFEKRVISASKCYRIIDLLIAMFSFEEYENEFFFLWNARVS